jgi:hypothetical protein
MADDVRPLPRAAGDPLALDVLRCIEHAVEDQDGEDKESRADVVVADAGYWKTEAIEALVAQGIQPLVAPDADRRKEPTPGRRGGLYDFMRRVLATDLGSQLYARRQAIIEPVFGQIKHNRGAERFQRAAAQPPHPNGGCWPPPTTSSSSGDTPPRPRRPEADTGARCPTPID